MSVFGENENNDGPCTSISHPLAFEVKLCFFYRIHVGDCMMYCESFSPDRLFFDFDLFDLSGLLSSDSIARSEEGDKERLSELNLGLKTDYGGMVDEHDFGTGCSAAHACEPHASTEVCGVSAGCDLCTNSALKLRERRRLYTGLEQTVHVM